MKYLKSLCINNYNNQIWFIIPAYSICFFTIEYYSNTKAFLSNSIVDNMWAAPNGVATVIVLPALCKLYLNWLDDKFPLASNQSITWNKRLLIDGFPYCSALLFCLIDHPLNAYTISATLVWAITHFLTRVKYKTEKNNKSLTQTPEYIAILFYISGFSALIYQIVWQRILFTSLGVDSESITIIVSVFMLGLGVGALFGAWLVRYKKLLLRIFLIIEIGIGLFGLFSVPIISYLLITIPYYSKLNLIAISYLLFFIPTLLMGATLPILIGYINLHYKDIGRSTSLLYSANTLGSATAALITVSVIFVLTGLKHATMIAAFFNIVTAILLFCSIKSLEEITPDIGGFTRKNVGIAFWRTAFIAFIIGFISLSGEMVYFRLLSFTSGGLPQIFGWLLASYLLGIALGSFRIKLVCESQNKEFKITNFLFYAALIILFTPLIMAITSALSGRILSLLTGFLLCGLFGFFTGGILPYLGIITTNNNEHDGSKKMALLYMFNIVGSALGPLITGYYLFEYLAIPHIAILLAIMLFMLINYMADKKFNKNRLIWLSSITIITSLFFSKNYLSHIQNEDLFSPPLKHIIENRVSIITVEEDNIDKDIIYGGGIYDGRFNIDPLNNSNGILRTFYIACLHPNPEKTLEIGLSSGSGLKILSTHKAIKELSSLEINPGYHEVILKYPDIADILNDNIHIYFDDGRKWLRQNSEKKFDLIVMNTTFHWRANSTNLLSKEFLELVKAHLLPGGVFYYNSTDSADIGYTAASVFEYIVKYDNFYAVSDAPFSLDENEREQKLLLFVDEHDNPLLQLTDKHKKVLEQLTMTAPKDIGQELRQASGLNIITDDNMHVEYKRYNSINSNY